MDLETQRFVQSLGHVRWSWIFHYRSLLHIITGVVFTGQAPSEQDLNISSELEIFEKLSENKSEGEILQYF